MQSDRSLRHWLAERRRQALIALLGAMLAIVIYMLVDGDSQLGSLIQGLALSGVVAAAAYLFANYILYSDDLEPSRFYERIGELVNDKGLRGVAPSAPAVEWDRFLNHPPVMVLEGFVRYLDEPLDSCRSAFVDFFRHGGSLKLVLPDGEDAGIAAGIAQQFDPSNPTSPDRIQKRIAATRGWLEQAREQADQMNRKAGGSGCPSERLTIVTADRALNYWMLSADSRRALLGPYDNWARSGQRMPVFEFDLSTASGLVECFDNEMGRFLPAAQPASSSSSRS